MKLSQCETVATKDIGRGILLLKVGVNGAAIYRQWVGRKTRSAKRETTNLSLECSGPTEWVRKEWMNRYSVG